VSEEAVAAMAAAKPSSVAEQRVLYEAAHAQAAARNTEPAHAIEEENATSCASYAPPPIFRGVHVVGGQCRPVHVHHRYHVHRRQIGHGPDEDE
jgi:hypothetical protein